MAIGGYVSPGQASVGAQAVSSGSFGAGSVASGDIASGILSRTHLASGGLTSGSLASGTVGCFQLMSGGLTSGSLASGTIGNLQLMSGGLQSGAVGSGTVGNLQLASGGFQSGAYGSGTIITYSRILIDDSYTADETISGFCPVAISSGMRLVTAQGGSGLRMPAFGVSITNVLSGASVLVCLRGRLNVTSGLDKLWSGQNGRMLFVSTSGDLMTITEPTVATLSQAIGVAMSGAVMVTPSLIMGSGAAAIQSGIL